MAAKLECEICGGKLIGKPGGIFECENCGTEYSTEWAKAKIQEITGTVKVEGTVEVTGKVKVDGPVKVEGTVTAQNLIKRGMLALEERQWDDADNCFTNALKVDAENAEAYLGLSMANRHLSGKDAYAKAYINRSQEAKNDPETDRAIQFAGSELKNWFATLNEKREALLAETRERLPEIRKRIAPYQGLIAAGDWFSIGVNADGTIITAGLIADDKKNELSKWKDIKAISIGSMHIVGLKENGTVVAAGENSNHQCDVSEWTGIIAVAAGSYHTVGLKEDGTVVAVGEHSKQQCDVSAWKDIIAISASGNQTYGWKPDGTVLVAGPEKNAFEWTDIVAASDRIGLKKDGTGVVASGFKADVSEWTDVVALAAQSRSRGFAVKADGTVLSDISYGGLMVRIDHWKDIVAIAVGEHHIVGLMSNGKVVAEGDYRSGHQDWRTTGQCDVNKWKLFKSDAEKEPDYTSACALQAKGTEETLQKASVLFRTLRGFKDSTERAKICWQTFETMKKDRERTELSIEKEKLSMEFVNLKGLFSGRRRKEIESRLAEIEAELAKL